jgi:hypothetical protein
MHTQLLSEVVGNAWDGLGQYLHIPTHLHSEDVEERNFDELCLNHVEGRPRVYHHDHPLISRHYR